MSTTISSLLPPDFTNREQMGQYLEWTVSEYIEHWQKILSDGGRVPQLYARILQLALRHESALHGAETPPVAPELRDLPVRDLLFYFGEKSDSIAVNRLCVTRNGLPKTGNACLPTAAK